MQGWKIEPLIPVFLEQRKTNKTITQQQQEEPNVIQKGKFKKNFIRSHGHLEV